MRTSRIAHYNIMNSPPVASFAERLSSACSGNDSVILQVDRNTTSVELSPDHYEFGMTCQWNITVENDSVRDYSL